MREYLQVYRLPKRILDFGDNMVFKPVRTYNCILILSKQNDKEFEYCVMEKAEDISKKLSTISFEKMPYDSLDKNGWKLVDQVTFRNLRKIESQMISVKEFIRTGIALDSLISSQLLINIFEHNTPLHDGAVIVRGDRIIAATCYLPLSDNLSLNKNLGTRHRAGVGISEVSDSLTIIVSEETGRVSVARNGKLQVGLTKEELKDVLVEEQNKNNQEKQKHKSKLKLWKGLVKNEKKHD